MAAKIEKIYQITLSGEQDLLQKMKSVNKEFDTAKKRWKELKTSVSQGLSAADAAKHKVEIQQARLEYERLKQETIKLRNEGISLTNQNKQITLSQRQAREESRNSIDAYRQLNQQYKDAKNNALNLGASLGMQSPKFREASAEAQKYYKQLKQLEAATGIYNRNVGNYPLDMGANFSSGMKKYFDDMKGQLASFAMGYVGFQAVIGSISSTADNMSQLSDQTTNLEIELGKATGGAKGLVNELSKLDTRTKLTELSNISNIAVKAGVDENNLVGVTKAIDMIKIAFGKDFGDVEAGTESLVKLINIFEGEGNVNEDNLLRMGNAIRTIANESVASVPFLNDFSKRMAGLKGVSDISLPAVLGLASGFEQFGQTAEVSSTALVKIIPKLATDTAKYAKIAGITQAEFKKLLTSKPEEALIKVSEALVKGKGDIEGISQAFADSELGKGRVTSILGTLGKNADAFRKTIASAGEAYGDTSNILDAFNAKNENFAAKLDKIKKQFADLANNQALQKVFMAVATSVIFLIQTIAGIPFSIWIAGITLLTLAYWNNVRALAANIVQQTIFIARQAVGNAFILTGTAIMNAQAIALGILNAAWNVLNATVLIFSRIIPGLRAAWVSLNLTFMATPIGLILGGIAAIGGAMILMSAKTNDAADSIKKHGQAMKDNAVVMRVNDDINKKASESISDTSAKMDRLTLIAKDNSISLETRKKALQQLIDISPKYLKGLNLENIATAEGVKILNAYKNKLFEVARAKAAQAIYEEKSKQLFEEEFALPGLKKAKTEADKYKSDAFDKRSWGEFAKGVGGLIGIGDGDAEDKLDKSIVKIKTLKGELSVLGDVVTKNAAKSQDDTVGGISIGGSTDTSSTESEKKSGKYRGSRLTGNQKDYIKDLEASKNRELAILETSYTKGEILEEEYITKSLAINKSFHDKKIDYLKSGNAEERKQEAQAQLDKAKAESDFNDKLYTIRKKRFDDELKQYELDSQTKKDKILNNAYSTDQEKLDAQKIYYEESYNSQLNYNMKMIDLESKLSKSMIEESNARYRTLKQKQDEERRNSVQYQVDTRNNTLNRIDTIKDELTNANEINAAIAKRNILDNSSLSQQQKNIELKKIIAKLDLQNINTELGSVNAKILAIESEINLGKQLTKIELERFDILRKQKAVLEGRKYEAEKEFRLSGGNISAPSEGFSGLASALTRGYKNSDGIISLGKNKDGTSIDGTEMVGYAIAQSFDIAQQAMNNYFDAERQRIERSKQIAYERIDLEKEQALRYAQSNSEKEAIDKQATEKKKKADKEAGEQLKRVKKSEARIAFLTELANIWSTVWQLGPIAGPLMGSALSLLALARYGVTVDGINSVQYKRGGKFLGKGGRLSGPSHGNGGMPVYNPETGQKVAEMEGKEGIINADSMEDNTVYSVTGTTSQIASKLNSIGGGVDWFGGATLKKFESGGIFSWNRTQPPVFNSQIQSVNSMNENSESSERLARIEYSLEQLSKEAQKKVVLNPKDVTNYQRENQKQTEIGTLS
ncbi:phage tail tape measure protein [Elizabethkingia anophelis]|uniref:phage tail tape measure protein n=1 Tax=Elizabethkingia anophelis TaxID=1117645 RepID=UPI002010ECF8|nr:phage tail tape measure protein [Elizabethkingia anophelis]MCL1690841.1 hypothetical protein [Elizabethkingia anophelis]